MTAWERAKAQRRQQAATAAHIAVGLAACDATPGIIADRILEARHGQPDEFLLADVIELLARRVVGQGPDVEPISVDAADAALHYNRRAGTFEQRLAEGWSK